jgi:hypothetical protein
MKQKISVKRFLLESVRIPGSRGGRKKRLAPPDLSRQLKGSMLV